MIRRGIVSSIDVVNRRARVFFPDLNKVSSDLQFSGSMSVNDSVIVAFTSEHMTDGAIILNLSQSGGGGSGETYVHNQLVPASTWTITHNLDKYPSVTIVDSSGNVVIGDVAYIDNNTVKVTFTAAFSGKAYLN